MPIAFIPFEAFVPDGGAYGPNLSVAENLLPVFGSWRTLNKASAVSQVSGGPVTGGFVHIYQQARAVQFLRPDADDTDGVWLSSAGGGGDLWSQIKEENANDADFIFAPGAPTAQATKISLSNPPATPGSVDNILRWRYRIPTYVSGTWEVKLELLEGATVRATDTVTGTAAVTAWTQRTYNLSAPEIAAITGYNNLFLRFTATIAGAAQFARPDADTAVGSWVTNAGGSTNLYATIDEAVLDDADFIRTPTLAAGGAAYTYAASLSNVIDPLTDGGFTWRYRYRGANAGATLIARLKQGATLIKETTHAAIGTSFATQATALSTVEAALITDFTALSTEFEASYPAAVASTVAQFARPTSDVDNTHGWNDGVSAIDIWEELDETSPDDGTSAVFSNALVGGDVDSEYIAGLGTVLDPGVSAGHIVRFRWKRAGTGSASVVVVLLQGLTQIAAVASVNKSALDNTWSTETYTLSAAEADAITDYSQLRLSFVQPGLFDVNESFILTWAELEVPQPRRVEVSWVELEAASEKRVEVSWAEFEVPDASTTYRGDVPTIFAGMRTKLYEVAQSGWDDISKAGDYAGGSSNPGSWSFCSFGNHVVATNFVDPVQFREANAGDFKDLITSTDLPKARFCVPFKESLLLGNINLTGHDFDEVWWSAVGDIRDFDPDITTQADFQRLTSCPGQVTGLAGGDFALVFKRRSIHALDWMGGTTIVRVRDVSSSVGTPFPRSIVQADGLTYFWSGRSFYVTDGYSPPVPIGDDVVANYMGDAAFSGGAIQAFTPTSILQEDQLMIGWFDPAAGLVIWHYMGTGESGLAIGGEGQSFETFSATAKNAVSHHSRAIAYSPTEKRWTTIFLPLTLGGDPALAYCCQRGNVTGEETFLLKGTVGFDWNTVTSTSRYFRFSDSTTYRFSLSTKRQSIALDENDRPAAVRITGILPAFSVSPSSSEWPDVSITAQASTDIQFQGSLQSGTYGHAKANEAGWYPHDLTGTWFDFAVAGPQATAKIVNAFRGLFVRYENRGRA